MKVIDIDTILERCIYKALPDSVITDSLLLENQFPFSLLQTLFDKRDLVIPLLVVEDRTEIVFRNLVALEQCHYLDASYITDYIGVMDILINMSRDVDIPIQKKVLINWLGDTDSMANLFTGLFKGIVMSTLKREYFDTPWKIAVSTAGILLLILAVIQTVCALIEVTHGEDITSI
ncbi:uncharacterized protein LOC109818896 [Cajanus cajan]|uniref:uncharacterized protein LOC109818896 n=1 Tax=Cajanus cajan TaxID=3821 RepID=UPI00098DA05B|nr:uncharacterized protein LOC109818896 [Cajanus cajan]